MDSQWAADCVCVIEWVCRGGWGDRRERKSAVRTCDSFPYYLFILNLFAQGSYKKHGTTIGREIPYLYILCALRLGVLYWVMERIGGGKGGSVIVENVLGRRRRRR